MRVEHILIAGRNTLLIYFYLNSTNFTYTTGERFRYVLIID